MSNKDIDFLRVAIDMAYEARRNGEDPFGAVLVYKDKIVHKVRDRTIELSDPTAHAEVRLISEYCRESNNIYLKDYTLYSSTEPCAMCAGAIHWAKISRVVYSVSQKSLNGLTNGKAKSSSNSIINSGKKKIEICGPLIEEEGLRVFKDFTFVPKNMR